MRKKLSFITFIFIIILCLVSFQKEAYANNGPLTFNDVDSSKWAWDSIYYLTGEKVINGYGGGRFGPNDYVTRGQAATMLVREIYPDAVATITSPYSDLPANHDFYEEIMVATEKGVFEGNESGKFNPDKSINRAAVAKILALAYDLDTGNTTVNFNDIKGHWGEEHISILSSNAIINGYPDQTFRPQKNVKRSEFAKMLAETLVHKDPSIWFTPDLQQVRSPDSLRPDADKTYHFTDNFGGYKLKHLGWDNMGNPRFEHINNQEGLLYYEEYYETEEGIERIISAQDQIVDHYLEYPLFVGKTWSNEIGVLYSFDVLNTVTSMNETFTTPAGTFNNLVEVTEDDGFLRYFAKGYGQIAVYKKQQMEEGKKYLFLML